ncbi:MAG: hypothetical protein AAGC73_03250 [Verrucomicrobiota bacterium]
MLWEVLFVIAVVIALISLFWWITRSASERIVAQYSLMADRFDVELTVPPPQLGGFIRPEPFLHGTYRNSEFSISVPGKGLQNTRQIESMLKMEVANKEIDLQMGLSSGMSRFSRSEGGKQKAWKSGDANFDTTIAVRTATPEKLDALLTADARDAFLKLLKGSKGTIYMGKGTLTFAEYGLIADAAKRELFQQAVETFCDFSESLEN